MTHEGERLRQLRTGGLGIRRIGIAAAAKLCAECLGLRIYEFQMHGSIIYAGSFVDVDVEPVSGLHLQRSLNTCFRENSNGRIAPIDGIVHTSTDFGEFCLLRFLLLSVIITRQPPCGVVTCHGKL